MRNLNLSRSVPEARLSLVLVLSALLHCQPDGKASDIRYVNAVHGLYFRESPSLGSRAMGLIPYGSRVRIIEQLPEERFLAGRKGRWSRIQWEDKEGWAFSGFLQTEELSTIYDHSLDGLSFRQGHIAASGECIITGPGSMELEDGNVRLPLISSGNLCKDEALHGTYTKEGNRIKITWRYKDIDEACKNEQYQAENWKIDSWILAECQDGRLSIEPADASGKRDILIESR